MNSDNYINQFEHKCNHDPNSPNSTLKMLAKRGMVFPPEYDFFCIHCYETFKFKKKEDGKFYFIDN